MHIDLSSVLDSIVNFLKVIEGHKDIAVFGAAFWIVWKFWADRKEARQQVELDLRRQAYFEYFSSIPLQLAELGKCLRTDELMPEMVLVAHQANGRLHLLAEETALQLAIYRNACYHQSIFHLTALKTSALKYDQLLELMVQENAGENVVETAKKERSGAWENVWSAGRERLIELNENYRLLLVEARREIGLSTKLGAVLKTLEKDQNLALSVFDAGLNRKRAAHGLPLK